MSTVALASVVHDPDGRLFRTMADTFAPLFALHDGAFVVISAATGADVERELRQLGAHVERERRPGVADGRRQALAMARRAGRRFLHYCDLDRALHWARCYPDEMVATLARVPSADLLIIGRTPRAFASHPRCLTETEALANHVFALAFGHHWDLCAAARGLSAAAADLVLERSRVVGVGTEAEWPAIILSHGGLAVAYVEVEGMEYETADRYREEVAAAGGLEAWTELQSRSPADWALRLAYAHAIARAALRSGEE